MDARKALEILSEEGQGAGSDFNDGVNGWFGWEVRHTDARPELHITFEDTDTGVETVHRFGLTEI